MWLECEGEIRAGQNCWNISVEVKCLTRANILNYITGDEFTEGVNGEREESQGQAPGTLDHSHWKMRRN